MKMIQIIWNSYWGKPSKLQKKFGKDYGNCFEFNDIIELNELAKYCERHYLSRPSLLGYKNEIKIIRIIEVEHEFDKFDYANDIYNRVTKGKLREFSCIIFCNLCELHGYDNNRHLKLDKETTHIFTLLMITKFINERLSKRNK